MTGPSSWLRTTNGCSITSRPTPSTSCWTGGSSDRAARSWPWSWKKRGTAGSRATRRDRLDGGNERLSFELCFSREAFGRGLSSMAAPHTQGGNFALCRAGVSDDQDGGLEVYERR